MTIRTLASVLTVAMTIGFCSIILAEDEKKEEKKQVTIKEIMAEMKPKKLKDKVTKGEASVKERLAFLDMMITLSNSKPPRGDEKSWKKLTDATLVAAAKVAVGREGAEAELKKATSCAACHKAHKPKAK